MLDKDIVIPRPNIRPVATDNGHANVAILAVIYQFGGESIGRVKSPNHAPQ